ncbi:MAG TPA: TolC family protein [Gemmatimonadaceae bacterium]
MRPWFLVAAVAAPLLIGPPRARGQGLGPPVAVSRSAAIDSALRRGGRMRIAAADTQGAVAGLLAARLYPDPAISAAYSKSVPNYHVAADLPLDLPGVRGVRMRAASRGVMAARFRLAAERAAVAMEADTAYTRAQAAREISALSQRNARDADSLRRIAEARRAAGDASDLDVDLATVAAGQVANVAATDSLQYLSAVLDLQAIMGLTAAGVVVVPSDPLEPPEALPGEGGDRTGPTLPVMAAEAALQAATLATVAQRRQRFARPNLTAGLETGDPTGAESGLLPTFGLAFSLPLFDRNRGAIATARADEARARAELSQAVVTSRVELARARRELAAALTRVERDRLLVDAAGRVARRALTAYREGAAPLATVLEAQRNARDVLAQFITDIAAARIAGAELRVLTPAAASIP